MEHIKTCVAKSILLCAANDKGVHCWSGWPEAFCLDCYAQDLEEICLRNGCLCECHKKFWELYQDLKNTKI